LRYKSELYKNKKEKNYNKKLTKINKNILQSNVLAVRRLSVKIKDRVCWKSVKDRDARMSQDARHAFC